MCDDCMHVCVYACIAGDVHDPRGHVVTGVRPQGGH